MQHEAVAATAAGAGDLISSYLTSGKFV